MATCINFVFPCPCGTLKGEVLYLILSSTLLLLRRSLPQRKELLVQKSEHYFNMYQGMAQSTSGGDAF